MPAQPFHDLDALGDRGAEVPGAFHQVALVQVVRAHADAHQIMHQLALDVRAVIHPGQQHGLIQNGDTRIDQPSTLTTVPSGVPSPTV